VNGIGYREDRSNAGTKYTRNKIRHLVIPVLKEINPSIEETLNETAGRLSDIREIISDFSENMWKQVATIRGKQILVNIQQIRDLQISRAILFEQFRRYGMTGTILTDLIRLLSGRSGRQLFTKTHRIVRDRNELIISPLDRAERKVFELSRAEDLQDVPYFLNAEVIPDRSGFSIPEDRSIACIDYDLIRFPLIVRGWKNGDFYYPFGMNQKKKLSDYFIDRKFSILKKEDALIVESDGKIVWIVGERLDDRFRVTGTTSRILMIRSAKT
jgi:tRNA(Ile)-lysidine synthase